MDGVGKEGDVLLGTDTPVSDRHELAVQDATIAWTDSGGSGEPVLLVHAGVFADWFGPLTAQPALTDHRVITMVRAGYTGSSVPTPALTVADHARHCVALLEALDLPSAHVLAHSSGTVIALQLVLDHPDRVASLLLSEPALLDPLVAPSDLDTVHATLGPALGTAIAAAAAGDLRTAFDTFLRTVAGPDYLDVLTSALGADGIRRAQRESGDFFAHEVPAMNRWTFDHAQAARIRQPVLLIQGGTSPSVVHRLIAHLAAMLPNTQTATLDGQDHLLPLGAPAALAALTVDHTRRHPVHHQG